MLIKKNQKRFAIVMTQKQSQTQSQKQRQSQSQIQSQNHTPKELSKTQKLKGLFYGFILGDAVAAPFEFMKKNAKNYNYWSNHFDFPLTNKPTHKLDSMNRPTDDSENLAFTLNSLRANDGQVVQADIAKRLVKWAHEGIPELGDFYGRGLGGTLGLLCQNPNFVVDPAECAKTHKSASNGALMRCSAIIFFENKDYDKMLEKTALLCRVTHNDPRTIASCLVYNTLLWNCLNNEDRDYLHFGDFLKNYTDFLDFRRYACFTDLSSCELDGHDKTGYFYNQIGYCLKCMACAVYAYRNREKNIELLIKEISLEFGDADTNAAIAASIIGCYQGYDSLPQKWLTQINGLSYMDRQIAEILAEH